MLLNMIYTKVNDIFSVQDINILPKFCTSKAIMVVIDIFLVTTHLNNEGENLGK